MPNSYFLISPRNSNKLSELDKIIHVQQVFELGTGSLNNKVAAFVTGRVFGQIWLSMR